MVAAIITFTPRGKELQTKIESLFQGDIWIHVDNANLDNQLAELFKMHVSIIFISAAGIAVRKTLPYIQSKMTDSAVIVIDEDAKFVIPVLSGHLGGANTIARSLAYKLNSQAVITTATDINNLFSIDEFAKINGFKIENKDGIKKISSRVLSGCRVSIYIDPSIKIMDKDIPPELVPVDYDKEHYADIVISGENREFDCTMKLTPNVYTIGIGCRKGKPFEDLLEFVSQSVPVDFLQYAYALASIDLKQKETGLNILAQYLNIPFETFSAAQLNSAIGNFNSSEYVQQVTGVDNVCERAAVLCAANNELIIEKISGDGMTVAVAVRKPRIIKWRNL